MSGDNELEYEFSDLKPRDIRKETRDKLKTEEEKNKFDKYISQGYSAAKALALIQTGTNPDAKEKSSDIKPKSDVLKQKNSTHPVSEKPMATAPDRVVSASEDTKKLSDDNKERKSIYEKLASEYAPYTQEDYSERTDDSKVSNKALGLFSKNNDEILQGVRMQRKAAGDYRNRHNRAVGLWERVNTEKYFGKNMFSGDNLRYLYDDVKNENIGNISVFRDQGLITEDYYNLLAGAIKNKNKKDKELERLKKLIDAPQNKKDELYNGLSNDEKKFYEDYTGRFGNDVFNDNNDKKIEKALRYNNKYALDYLNRKGIISDEQYEEYSNYIDKVRDIKRPGVERAMSLAFFIADAIRAHGLSIANSAARLGGYGATEYQQPEIGKYLSKAFDLQIKNDADKEKSTADAAIKGLEETDAMKRDNLKIERDFINSLIAADREYSYDKAKKVIETILSEDKDVFSVMNSGFAEKYKNEITKTIGEWINKMTPSQIKDLVSGIMKETTDGDIKGIWGLASAETGLRRDALEKLLKKQNEYNGNSTENGSESGRRIRTTDTRTPNRG